MCYRLEERCTPHYSLKGTVSREKLFSWGEMDWTLTIDSNWFSHFPDQLFNCYNLLTVCRLYVKPVGWLSATAAFRRLLFNAVVAVRCLLCPVVAIGCLIVCGLPTSCAPPPPTTSSCLIHPLPLLLAMAQCHTHTAHLLCCCCSPHPNTVLLLQSAP